MNVRDDKTQLRKTLSSISNHALAINVKLAVIRFGRISGRLSFVVVFYFPKGIVRKHNYRKNQREDMRLIVARRLACRYDKVVARREILRPTLENLGIAVAGLKDFRWFSHWGCLLFQNTVSTE